jgi:hypothetical protein
MGKLLERLKDPSRSGVYRVRSDGPVLDALAEGGVSAVTIGLEGASTKAELLRRIASALAFPDWFGGNWDALEDCLTEVHGYVLFNGYEGIAADDLGVLLDVLRSGAQFHAAQGKPFFAIFIDPRRSLGIEDLFREA